MRLYTARCLVIALAVIALDAGLSAQIPAAFTNLQVLPKDITRAELVATMRGIAGALGVRCTHCHVGPDNLQGMDFATDEQQSKRIARSMLQMVRSINSDFVSTLPAAETPRQQVTCIMCHRSASKPPRPLSDILLSTIEANGVQAAIARYRRLRAEALVSGLYDFRESTLNIVATRLREQKAFPAALEILRLNAEIFPRSAAVQVNLGDTAVESGDLSAARQFYQRALEIDPANTAAKQGLSRLEGK